MTLEQIQLLKDSYMKEAKKPNGQRSTLGEYMAFCLDGGVALVTSKDLVIFDGDNELLHGISINDDMVSQSDFPIKITSSEYAMVQQVEAILSQANFEKLLDEGFLSSMVGDEKKKFILNWSRSIRNQAQQPMDPEPCYEDMVHEQIKPMGTSVLPKEDTSNSDDDSSDTETDIEETPTEDMETDADNTEVETPTEDESTTNNEEAPAEDESISGDDSEQPMV